MSRQPRAESVRAEGERIPVSSNRAPLQYRGEDRKNYFYRWVLDKNDRIAKFLEGGYEFVKPAQKNVGEKTVETESQDKQGSLVTKASGTGGLRLIYMRIKKEWYDQDQLAKAKEVDDQEASMRPVKSGKAGADYGSISLTRKNKAFDTAPE